MANRRRLAMTVEVRALRLSAPFRISGYVFHDSPVLLVTLTLDKFIGRGEASGVYYLDDTPERMAPQVESVREAIEGGVSHQELRRLLPPGGARNAVDCALWELEAQRADRPVWELAGAEEPRPLMTTFTLGADEPAVMAQGAKNYAQARALKLKLTGERDLDAARVAAVRAARPDVWIGVDANQGFTIDELDAFMPALLAADVSLIEQPLARGCEADLKGFERRIPIAADESVQSLADIEGLVGRFDVMNIKLDKCGGLTEALMMLGEARLHGLKPMVGNMIGTSLAMAPAFVVGQSCEIVDLDGPIFLAEDHFPSVRYTDGNVWCGADVWGGSLASAA